MTNKPVYDTIQTVKKDTQTEGEKIMGCFYTGFDWRNRKNGYFKIGESGKKTPAMRLAAIRQTDAFQCLGYLLFINDTKPQRLFVESYVRMKMAEQYEHTQTDHFLYTIEQGNKYGQATEMTKQALTYAEEACKIAKVQYKYGTRTYTR